MANATVAQLLRQRQEEFIERRTKIETEVNMFLKSIGNMDADIQAECKYNPEYTARHWLPALWQEPFDPETYKKQLANFNAYERQVDSICNRLAQEAMVCLQT